MFDALAHQGARISCRGWFDHLTRGQLRLTKTSVAMVQQNQHKAHNVSSSDRGGHGNIGNTGPDHCRYGDWDLGTEADLPVLAHELQFLDFHLKEIDNGYTSQPPVKVFLMGDNRWIPCKIGPRQR